MTDFLFVSWLPDKSAPQVGPRYDLVWSRNNCRLYRLRSKHGLELKQLDDGDLGIVVSKAFIPDEQKFWSDFRQADRTLSVDPLSIDGHFAVALISEEGVRVLTDCGGTIPVFVGRMNRRVAVGTNINDVAAALDVCVDEISVYDFLDNGRVVHPYTWFKGIKTCDPASVSFVSADPSTPIRADPYWEPRDALAGGELHHPAEIRRRMSEAVAHATDGYASCSLFYSGGDDCRTVASLIPAQVDRQGFIFLNAKNREYVLAQISARLLGFRVHLLERGDDHYLRNLVQNQDMVGFGFDLFHAHSIGFESRIPEGLVLGGYAANTLFKGHVCPRAGDGEAILGRVDNPFNATGPAAEKLSARHLKRLSDIRATAPETGFEVARYWPFWTHEHYGHFAASRRLYDIAEPFMFSRNFSGAQEVSTVEKASHRAFNAAFAKGLGAAGFVPRSGGEIIALSKQANKRVAPLVKKAFRLHDRFWHPDVPQGPWVTPIRQQTGELADFVESISDSLLSFDDGRLGGEALLPRRGARRGEARRNFRLVQIASSLKTLGRGG